MITWPIWAFILWFGLLIAISVSVTVAIFKKYIAKKEKEAEVNRNINRRF